jgi:tRNA(adenine34) deaminase
MGVEASSGLAVRPEHEAWMRMALAVAGSAQESGDIPVGAVVVGADGTVLGLGHNIREAVHDPTGHAEVVALRAAAQTVGRWRLEDAILVVTLEPCAMCAGAAVAARVGGIVFGAWDEKAGACGSVWDLPRDRAALHRPEVYAGVLAEDCAQLLTDFFAARRG